MVAGHSWDAKKKHKRTELEQQNWNVKRSIVLPEMARVARPPGDKFHQYLHQMLLPD